VTDVSKLQTLFEAVKARLGQEQHAADWGAAAATEQELRAVSEALATAQAAAAQRAAEADAQRAAAAVAARQAAAEAEAADLGALWALWVGDMTDIDQRLDELALARRELERRAGALYQYNIGCPFLLPERLLFVVTNRIPTIRT